ncbi:hypothetical protein [Streptomyces millisiae]|uniref:Uncharacterized protein n=1 Tax=Streptomyces millisiae TaxID=3075542 RepID=A0ABU2LX04_9ACTN|nr:hypothetical protein [Streptomyces sp. DSM 44918]MDT0322140.1 hypothetical protein [Streptomyces sp. DSM 44918]
MPDRPELSPFPRPADVAQLCSAARLHAVECLPCAQERPCEMELRLSRALTAALDTAHVAPAPLAGE